MRALTAAQSNILTLPRSHIAKVEIDRTGAGAWVDITNLQARNWVRAVSITDSVDAATASATVTLQRAQSYFNLSPLMASSLLNVGGVLVTIYRKIRISIATVPVGMTPAASDFQMVFIGRIYQIDWAADEIKIDARDRIGDLMDLFIETNSITYGSTAGILAQSVMQSILTNQAPPTDVATLYSINGTVGTPFNAGDSPAWLIKTYKQDLMPTQAALQVIAQQIGWLLKWRWNVSAATYVLTWYDPQRGGTTSLRTFTASQYYALTECSLHLGDIRNFVRVFYKDVNGNTQSVTSNDATSITNYGRKYMQVAEEATSQINTSTEAQKMADGCKTDLSLPVMTHIANMPLFWPVELGDLYTFAANNVHYDTDQKLAVYAYTHSISNNKGETSISLRGKPCGGVSTWLDREVQQVRKIFGTTNLLATPDAGETIYPNGNFGQSSRG